MRAVLLVVLTLAVATAPLVAAEDGDRIPCEDDVLPTLGLQEHVTYGACVDRANAMCGGETLVVVRDVAFCTRTSP